MNKMRLRKWLGLLSLSLALVLAVSAAAAADRPALVLAAFGTSTAAADTYQHMDALARKRFPGCEIRWAFTSLKVREKAGQRGEELKDLPQVLKELKAAGFTRVAVQSLHVVPGEEWDRKIIQASQQVPGLHVALGKPLLFSEADQVRVLEALKPTFPRDLKATAVVLVGHGSPSPAGEGAYLAFEKLLRSSFPHQNVFLGVVEGKPDRDAALNAVKQSGAAAVVFMPLLVVAGEHMQKDILGEAPDSWKSRLLDFKPYRTESSPPLGYNDDIVQLYLDHLKEALESLPK